MRVQLKSFNLNAVKIVLLWQVAIITRAKAMMAKSIIVTLAARLVGIWYSHPANLPYDQCVRMVRKGYYKRNEIHVFNANLIWRY
jgi:hypothetical protein